MSGRVRVIALGSRCGNDDEAALIAAERVGGGAEVVLAGRPGVALLELLEPGRTTVIVDVVRAGLRPGEVIRMPLAALLDRAIAGRSVSSHGLGAAEALRLLRALGRPLPPGSFVGIEAVSLAPCGGMSRDVRENLAALTAEITAAVRRGQRP